MKTQKNKPTKVQKLVYSMLTENTGAHFLDSGFANGRHWQKNAKKSINDFMNEEPEAYYLDRTYKEIERNVSVFHYLSNLELDHICDKFNRLNKNTKDWDGDFYGVSSKAQYYLDALIDSSKEARIWNTYNGNSDLSQVLQGVNLRLWNDGQYEDYILIQVHNGADVRGGYTDAKLFKMHDDFYNIFEYKDQYEILEDLEYITVLDENNNVVSIDELNEIFELV